MRKLGKMLAVVFCLLAFVSFGWAQGVSVDVGADTYNMVYNDGVVGPVVVSDVAGSFSSQQGIIDNSGSYLQITDINGQMASGIYAAADDPNSSSLGFTYDGVGFDGYVDNSGAAAELYSYGSGYADTNGGEIALGSSEAGSASLPFVDMEVSTSGGAYIEGNGVAYYDNEAEASVSF